MSLLATDPTLVGDLALVAAFRTLAGVIDYYRDQVDSPTTTTAQQLQAWTVVQDSARDVAWTLLFTPDEDPRSTAVDALAKTLVEQVRAPWDRA